MNRRDTKQYEFGRFRLEAAERRLLCEGEAIPLKAKIFDLLLFLLQRKGQLVEKDELMREVWPNTVVEENNITVSMSILRKILGVYGTGGEYIQTVPRIGYRFVAEVKEIDRNGASGASGTAASATAPAHVTPTETYNPEPHIDSLAVLPFMNVGNNPDIEYLSEGITESIINMLSQIPRLRVMARSTVFCYKGREVSPQEVGEQLKVRTVMLGRMLQLGERLIIRTELVNVADGSQIWGEQYNSQPSDLLQVQDEIATAISERLKVKLTGPEKIRIKKRYTENIEAFNLYLRGRYFWNKYTKDWVLKGIEAFQQAIELDANYALAYAGIADAYFRLSNVHLPPREGLPKAEEAALKAVEIDDELAEAHASLGLIKVYKDHDWEGAEAEFKRALELNPDLVLVHQRFGSYLKFMGRFEESMAHYRHALELDPFSLQINMNLATNHYLMGNYDEAIQHLKLTLELEPNYMPTHFALGCTYIQQGLFAEAIEEFQTIYRKEEDAYLALGFMGYAYAKSNQMAEARNILNVLQDISTHKYVSPYSMLLIHLGLGQKGRALNLLDKLYEEGNDWLVWLKVAPELRSLHSEPRFKALLQRVGFSL